MKKKIFNLELGSKELKFKVGPSNGNYYPYWSSVAITFNQTENGDWVSDNEGLFDIVVGPDNVYERCPYTIPSLTVSNVKMEGFIEEIEVTDEYNNILYPATLNFIEEIEVTDQEEKDTIQEYSSSNWGSLKGYGNRILYNIPEPEYTEEYREYAEEYGNEFADDGPYRFDIEIDGYEIRCEAEFTNNEWCVTVEEYDLWDEQTFEFGNGNSFDSLDELKGYFERNYADEIEIKEEEEDDDDDDDDDEEEE